MTRLLHATLRQERPETHDRSKCVFCQNFHEFVLPDHLLNELTNGNVVIFAGAGVSTESSTVFPSTLYNDVHVTLGLHENDRPPFPTLMSRLCAHPNGRRELLQMLQKRFAYVVAFPELYRVATRFHRELSTIFYVDTVITTNWDDYFERECGAIPFVTPEDFSLWDVPGRKVFKLHGSVNNYGSIIATEDDYLKAQTQLEKGSLGSALKLALATKTILYVGYSFSDHDFNSIQNYIRNELSQIAPAAYIVSLDESSDIKFKELGLHPIYTDATYFLTILKQHLENDGHYLSDSRFDSIPAALERARFEHSRLFDTYRLANKPEIVFTAAYQDGLIHAFERILAMRKTGQYSHECDVVRQVQNYEKIRTEKQRRKRYWDVAYIDGYASGLLYLVLDDDVRRKIPYYYLYGSKNQPITFTQFRRTIRDAKPLPVGANTLARKIASETIGSDIVFHHTPFLG